MSAKWKGGQGPIEEHREGIFDAETLSYEQRRTERGSAIAISARELQLQQQLISYQVSNNGPVYDLTYRVPLVLPDTQPLDRYEISTESDTYEIWQVPAVVEAAATYDAGLAVGAQTWRQVVEDWVKGPTATSPPGLVFPLVVKYLKAGVDHFPIDYLVLRRFRRVDLTYGQTSAGQFDLEQGNKIYSTGQLVLPAAVAFTIPNAPATNASYDALFAWGWRRRSQSVEIIGQWLEQRVELVFGQHSLLVNTISAAELVW